MEESWASENEMNFYTRCQLSEYSMVIHYFVFCFEFGEWSEREINIKYSLFFCTHLLKVCRVLILMQACDDAVWLLSPIIMQWICKNFLCVNKPCCFKMSENYYYQGIILLLCSNDHGRKTRFLFSEHYIYNNLIIRLTLNQHPMTWSTQYLAPCN